MAEEKKTEQPQEATQQPPMKQIIFLENGQVVWPEGVFRTLADVEDFLQRIVYRDWQNEIYKNIMKDLTRQNQARQAEMQAKAVEQAETGVPAPPPPEATASEPKPDLKIVEEQKPAAPPEKNQEQLRAELAAKKAEIEAIEAKLNA